MSETRPTASAGSTNGPSATDRAKDEGRRLVDEGRREASEVTNVARSETASIARKTGDDLRRRADDQTGQMAGMLESLADELDEVASASDREGGHLTGVARDGARASRRMAERLERDGLDGVVHDVNRFARRRPGMFLAAAFGTGLLLGRLTRNVDTGEITERARHDGDRADGDRSDGLPRPTGQGPASTVRPGAAVGEGTYASAAASPTGTRAPSSREEGLR